MMRVVQQPSAARFVLVANPTFTMHTLAAHAAHGPAAEAINEGARS